VKITKPAQDIDEPPEPSQITHREKQAKDKKRLPSPKSHKEAVEWDLVQKATVTLWFLLATVVVLTLGEFVVQGIWGWEHNDFIRETARLLGSVISLLLGFLFSSSRK